MVQVPMYKYDECLGCAYNDLETNKVDICINCRRNYIEEDERRKTIPDKYVAY